MVKVCRGRGFAVETGEGKQPLVGAGAHANKVRRALPGLQAEEVRA